ncbi:MAG TPA: phosphoribosylformylglycinamidine synthase subunit PurS [Nitrospirota bacterium]|nr:phosphoribosylformylglycinamidine synthase subunit PurS [Nitrospirota bacterium]
MKVSVYVTLKNGILDPQGKAVKHSLHSLGYTSVADVRIGKYIELILDDASGENLDSQIKEMCNKLLANTIVEDFRYEIEK